MVYLKKILLVPVFLLMVLWHILLCPYAFVAAEIRRKKRINEHLKKSPSKSMSGDL